MVGQDRRAITARTVTKRQRVGERERERKRVPGGRPLDALQVAHHKGHQVGGQGHRKERPR